MNNGSNVEPVEVATKPLTEEGKNVENDESNLKHKLNTEHDVTNNEFLAKRTKHQNQPGSQID